MRVLSPKQHSNLSKADTVMVNLEISFPIKIIYRLRMRLKRCFSNLYLVQQFVFESDNYSKIIFV